MYCDSLSANFWRNDLDSREVMVTIRCITYNHEHYIRDALEGFVKQQTNFRFEAIVHDDASTDNTAEVIREYAEKYPSIIKPIYETENQYSKHDGTLQKIMLAHTRGKYVAFCEGDDYWIDPLKLQKQVDFLEANQEYVLVHANVLIDNFGVTVKTNDSLINNKQLSLPICERLLRREYIVRTATVVVRNDVYRFGIQKDPFLFSGDFLMGDTPLWFVTSLNGKFFFLAEDVAVYRRHTGSASNSNGLKKTLRFNLSMFEMRMYLAKHYHLTEQTTKWIAEQYNMAYKRCLLFIPDVQPLYKEDIRYSFFQGILLKGYMIADFYARLLVKKILQTKRRVQ